MGLTLSGALTCNIAGLAVFGEPLGVHPDLNTVPGPWLQCQDHFTKWGAFHTFVLGGGDREVVRIDSAIRLSHPQS